MDLSIIIMAAGEGKRMNSPIPKVLHKFHGIPMLVRIISESIKVNPNKIIVITGKFHDLIKSTISEYVNYDNIIYVKQLDPKGTGHAIQCILPYITPIENVLILNGDMPLINHKLLMNFLSDNSFAKLLVAKLEKPYGYGRILYENGIFTSIREEKDCSEFEKKIDIVNVGIYLFNGTILQKYIPLIDNNNVQNEYYLTDIIKIIKENEDIDINTYQIENKYKHMIYGVNTQEELKKLEESF
jgi:UDP-N-acetylglucosamine diphosphorylase/glucosamine-1-phosphate N-acetyltransferase